MLVLLISTIQPILAAAQVEQDQAIEFFERRIRPVLVTHCTSCHGDDPQDISAGLDLTSPLPSNGQHGGESLITPGDSAASVLFHALNYRDPELQMPPAGRLPQSVIDDFQRWIDMGAVDPRSQQTTGIGGESLPMIDMDMARDHWSYRPVNRIKPPRVDRAQWVSNPVDNFILARLEQEGLQPVPAADRRTLIRRASFDLLGLPPTPRQVEEFLDDQSDDAWSRLVDRLLDSDQYGVRWGRYWLDVARYSDSNGLDENTAFANAWKYRDWVIRAFNTDIPYDRFITMQIAGDLLPESGDPQETIDQLIATGFLSLGPKVLAEPDKEKMAIDIVDEQIDVIGKAMLAQTISCARCHDHKFDPIPTRDYYSLAGILMSTKTMATYNTVARVLEREQATTEEIRAKDLRNKRISRIDEDLQHRIDKARSKARDSWIRSTQQYLLAAHEVPLSVVPMEAERDANTNLGTNTMTWGRGIGILHTVNQGPVQFVTWTHHVDEPGSYQVSIRYASNEKRPVQFLVDDAVVAESILGESTGSFDPDGQTWVHLDSIHLDAGPHEFTLRRDGAFPHIDKYMISSPSQRDLDQQSRSIHAMEHGIREDVLERWQVHLAQSTHDDSGFLGPWMAFSRLASEHPDQFPERAAQLVQELRAGDGNKDSAWESILSGLPPSDLQDVASRYQAVVSTVGMLHEKSERAADSDQDPEPLEDEALESIRVLLFGPSGLYRVRPQQHDAFDEDDRKRIATLESKREEIVDSGPLEFDMTIAVEDGQVRDLPVHVRGSHTNLEAESVPRGSISVIDHLVSPIEAPDDASGRLELAGWMTDTANPLTARVMVNRIWQGHFGRGIVETSSNFGINGLRPSHPDLLDYLAHRFMEEGWSIKQMHRLIMNSSTYRMSSSHDEESMRLDPENRLIWRANRRRLEAEPIRDTILSVGGNLDLEIGGSLLRTGNFQYVTNDQSNSNERYESTRRAAYLPVIRNDMYSLFSTFDYTDPSVSIDRRPSTTVTQQALFMMNSPIIHQQAASFARNILESIPSGDHQGQVEHAYEIALSRPPTEEEVRRAIDFMEKVRSMSVEQDAEVGDSALASFCQVLMASSEFIHVN